MEAFDVNFVITVNYLGVLFFQIFFYCYYGTMLIEEVMFEKFLQYLSLTLLLFQNNTLSSAIYMSKWYEYGVTSKRALIILMERSKKPMVVVAGKVFDLSLQTFTTVRYVKY
jgi:hypothetical protein